VGDFEKGKRTGFGKLIMKRGHVLYEGKWLDNEFDGLGTYTQTDGVVYEGDWKKGVREGFGVQTWSNEDHY